MNHHFDTQIQACTNNDSRVCGVRAFGVQRFTKDIHVLEWTLKYNSQEIGLELGNTNVELKLAWNILMMYVDLGILKWKPQGL